MRPRTAMHEKQHIDTPDLDPTNIGTVPILLISLLLGSKEIFMACVYIASLSPFLYCNLYTILQLFTILRVSEWSEQLAVYPL
jgi:hypothetical protein